MPQYLFLPPKALGEVTASERLPVELTADKDEQALEMAQDQGLIGARMFLEITCVEVTPQPELMLK